VHVYSSKLGKASHFGIITLLIFLLKHIKTITWIDLRSGVSPISRHITCQHSQGSSTGRWSSAIRFRSWAAIVRPDKSLWLSLAVHITNNSRPANLRSFAAVQPLRYGGFNGINGIHGLKMVTNRLNLFVWKCGIPPIQFIIIAIDLCNMMNLSTLRQSQIDGLIYIQLYITFQQVDSVLPTKPTSSSMHPQRTPRFPSSNPISGSSMAHLESQSGLMFQQWQGSWCFNKHHSFLLLLSGGEFSHNSTTPSEVLRGLLKGGLCCSSSLGAPQVHKPLDRRVRVKQAGGQPQTCLVDTSKCLNYFRFHLAHSNFPLGTWAPHHRLGFFPSFSTHDHASDDSPPACSVFVGPWSQRNPQDSPAQNVTITINFSNLWSKQISSNMF
jgi:hypothetical protein